VTTYYTAFHQRDPHLFAQPPPPAVWTYTQLPQWLEAPMHLPMGIIRTVAGGWADDLGHGDTLVRFLQHLKRNLQGYPTLERHVETPRRNV
jgi:hypothetical protein